MKNVSCCNGLEKDQVGILVWLPEFREKHTHCLSSEGESIFEWFSGVSSDLGIQVNYRVVDGINLKTLLEVERRKERRAAPGSFVIEKEVEVVCWSYKESEVRYAAGGCPAVK